MLENSEKEPLSWVESSKFKNRSCGYLNKLSETESVIFLLIITQEKQVHNGVSAAVCVNYYYSLTFVSCTVLTLLDLGLSSLLATPPFMCFSLFLCALHHNCVSTLAFSHVI